MWGPACTHLWIGGAFLHVGVQRRTAPCLQLLLARLEGAVRTGEVLGAITPAGGWRSSGAYTCEGGWGGSG